MSHGTTVIALFDAQTDAEPALKRLRRAGLDVRKLSVVGKDIQIDEPVVDFDCVAVAANGDPPRIWRARSAFRKGHRDVRFTDATRFAFPGVGRVIVLGPLAGAIRAWLEISACPGDSLSLSGALGGLGIAKPSALEYERAIGAGCFALIVHGTEAEDRLAQRILGETLAAAVDVHCNPAWGG